jgi:S1-C subfamily serine protease
MSEMVTPLEVFSDALAHMVAKALPSTVTISGETESLVSGGSGSGWVFGDGSYVVTNAHVVQQMFGLVKVKPAGAPSLKGEIIGIDRETDLAILHVVGLNKPSLSLRPEPPRLGELCMAIGSPLGLRESASLGIISGLSRQSKHPDGFIMEEMLQTDASINAGNSGGPLLDARGLVLGVNTMGKGETVNFAVPTEMVEKIIPELIQYGSIKRASIGLSVSSQWTEQDGQLRSLVQIRSVKHKQSPLRPGDFLVKIGTTTIRRRLDIKNALDRDAIGRTLQVWVLRDGALVNLEVNATQRC